MLFGDYTRMQFTMAWNISWNVLRASWICSFFRGENTQLPSKRNLATKMWGYIKRLLKISKPETDKLVFVWVHNLTAADMIMHFGVKCTSTNSCQVSVPLFKSSSQDKYAATTAISRSALKLPATRLFLLWYYRFAPPPNHDIILWFYGSQENLVVCPFQFSLYID